MLRALTRFLGTGVPVIGVNFGRVGFLASMHPDELGEGLARAALAWPAAVVGVADSGLPGPKGNREFFLHLVHRGRPERPDELDTWIDRATG